MGFVATVVTSLVLHWDLLYSCDVKPLDLQPAGIMLQLCQQIPCGTRAQATIGMIDVMSSNNNKEIPYSFSVTQPVALKYDVVKWSSLAINACINYCLPNAA